MSEHTEIKNAIIEAVTLTKADHGLLSAWVHLDYGGSEQWFGGYSLYMPKSSSHHSLNINYAGHFIFRTLEIGDVDEWSQLKGKTVRAQIVDGRVVAIGHIVKEDWFNPGKDFDAAKEAPRG